jgi:alpha-amylase
MKQIYLGLAIHNHQPVGNFPWVFDEVFRMAYLPMVQAMERHPSIKLSLHYSGPILDWMREEHPEFLEQVAGLVRRGQVELMSGGYYEPILPVIPDADKLGQIAKLSQTIRERFGQQPSGLWLAERVWEPHLPLPLAQADIKWTLVDDTHFKLVGLDEANLFGYYLTEEQGYRLKVFPSSKRLRYMIPWRSVAEVIAYLEQQASQDNRIAVMGDDGEKFGSWPGTQDHCWERGWMEDFFKALERNSAWLKTVTLGEWAERFPAIGLAYIPAASYAEMMEWSLPTPARSELARLTEEMKQAGREDALRFIQCGFWRSFLAKYPEANAMHKKMLRVHDKVYALPPEKRQTAVDYLWKAQSNCPYWHGVFGGLYLPHIRRSNYNNLLHAETQADAQRQARASWLTWELADIDVDGYTELLVESRAQDLYFDLQEGGCIFEWDLKRIQHNLADTLARRREVYHQTIIEAERQRASDEKSTGEVKTIHEILRSKESGLERYLSYDWHRSACLIEHFLGAEATMDDFRRVVYDEAGDFANQPYQPDVEIRKDSCVIRLCRVGHIRHRGFLLPLEVEKSIRLTAGQQRLQVNYELRNLGNQELNCHFASEWNLALIPSAWREGRYKSAAGSQPLNDRGETTEVTGVSFEDQTLGFRLNLAVATPAGLWHFPVETVSNSEDGFERVFQGGCLLLHWWLSLKPRQAWSVQLDWGIVPMINC